MRVQYVAKMPMWHRATIDILSKFWRTDRIILKTLTHLNGSVTVMSDNQLILWTFNFEGWASPAVSYFVLQSVDRNFSILGKFYLLSYHIEVSVSNLKVT